MVGITTLLDLVMADKIMDITVKVCSVIITDPVVDYLVEVKSPLLWVLEQDTQVDPNLPLLPFRFITDTDCTRAYITEEYFQMNMIALVIVQTMLTVTQACVDAKRVMMQGMDYAGARWKISIGTNPCGLTETNLILKPT